MIAWLVIAVLLGALAGLATHACADAVDPEKRRLKAEHGEQLRAMGRLCDESIQQARAQARKELAEEDYRLKALQAKLRAWETELHGGESMQRALERIDKQLEFINKRLNAVDDGYGFLLGREEDPP